MCIFAENVFLMYTISEYMERNALYRKLAIAWFGHHIHVFWAEVVPFIFIFKKLSDVCHLLNIETVDVSSFSFLKKRPRNCKNRNTMSLTNFYEEVLFLKKVLYVLSISVWTSSVLPGICDSCKSLFWVLAPLKKKTKQKGGKESLWLTFKFSPAPV